MFDKHRCNYTLSNIIHPYDHLANIWLWNDAMWLVVLTESPEASKGAGGVCDRDIRRRLRQERDPH